MSRDRGRGWPKGFVGGRRDRDALLVLAHLDGLTPRTLNGLAWDVGSAEGCLDAVLRGAAGSANDREFATAIDPGEVRSRIDRCEARFVTPAEEDYLPALLDLHDPPACLFIRGRAPPADAAVVAIVGARRCSPYGREVAESIGRGLASAAVTVVSGAARGIDGASHRGALAGNGSTIAVLGSGIDVAYPAGNRRLIEEIAARGTVVSEYPPGVAALRWRFPARNRIVAALGRAVVIVEGARGSGSMITAEFALELGREVHAVPGSVTSPLSEVPNSLIREGAGLVRGPEDVLEALGMAGVGARPPANLFGELTGQERTTLERVTGPGVSAEVVAREAGVGVAAALSALASLELKGLVRRVGGRYERVLSG